MSSNLPQWAEDVLLDYASKDVDRWRTRWLELREFVRHLEALPDAGKKIVFERAVYVGAYSSGTRPREAKIELQRINEQILDHLSKAVGLFHQRSQLKADHEVQDGMANMFDAISSAIDEYPTWAYVAQHETRRFLAMRGQSRSGPAMPDLLEAYVGLSDPNAFSNADSVVCASQKKEADHIRHMLSEMGELNQECLLHLGITDEFRLTDAAIAELVNVAFDINESDSVNTGTVKRRRQDAKSKGYDYWGEDE